MSRRRSMTALLREERAEKQQVQQEEWAAKSRAKKKEEDSETTRFQSALAHVVETVRFDSTTLCGSWAFEGYPDEYQDSASINRSLGDGWNRWGLKVYFYRRRAKSKVSKGSIKIVPSNALSSSREGHETYRKEQDAANICKLWRSLEKAAASSAGSPFHPLVAELLVPVEAEARRRYSRILQECKDKVTDLDERIEHLEQVAAALPSPLQALAAAADSSED